MSPKTTPIQASAAGAHVLTVPICVTAATFTVAPLATGPELAYRTLPQVQPLENWRSHQISTAWRPSSSGAQTAVASASGPNADIGTLASPLAWIVRMPGQA